MEASHKKCAGCGLCFSGSHIAVATGYVAAEPFDPGKDIEALNWHTQALALKVRDKGGIKQ